jgi:Raf kinase inhibitor-like YbhB/YbcL family protein
MRLTSTAFKDGQSIPKRHTEDGQNLSPPLAWSDVPEGVQEFAILAEDPDVPRAEPWVHWLIYGLAGDLRELPEGLPRATQIHDPVVATQGVNSWPQQNDGYRGPSPPRGSGRHRYYFRIYALDRAMNLAPRLAKQALLRAIDSTKVLAHAELMGIYQR